MTLNEQLRYMEELIRKVYSKVSSLPFESELNVMVNKETRKRILDKYPKCFLSLKTGDYPFFPICNRMGMVDPEMVNFSIKLCKKMKTSGKFSKYDFDSILIKLEKLHKKFTKDIPKPVSMAITKAKETRKLNKLNG